MYNLNDVVTVMADTGEYVGKFSEIDDNGQLVIADPRMVVANEQGMGFAAGIAMTGKQDPLSMTFAKYIFVTPTNDEVVSAYRQHVSGLII